MRRLFGLVLAGSMLPILFGSMYLHTYFADNRPRAPDASAGRVYPLNVHGTVVYLTRLEDIASTWVFFGGVLFGIIGGALLRGDKCHRS